MGRILTLIFAALMLSFSANARIKRVNNSPESNAQYASLENALIDCAAGDTILLEGSSKAYGPGDAYGYDPIRITKPVTIIGIGHSYKENEIVAYPIGESYIGSTLKIVSPRVNIIGCILPSIEIYSNECQVVRCQVLAGSQNAIEVADTVNGCIIRQSFLVGNVQGNGYPQNVNVLNNIICGNVSQFERSRIERNTFGKYNRFGGIRNLRFCSVIENVFNQNLKNSQTNTCSMLNNYIGDFTRDIENDDFSLDRNYRIKVESPLYNKASDGDQLGAFGGPLPYVVSGLSDAPIIKSYSAPSEVNSRTGLEVTITYKLDR